jgi:membrane protein required for colicin V production
MNGIPGHIALNLADYFIIAVILFSTLISLMRGFISEAISLFVWIIAFLIAFRSAEPISRLLSGILQTPSVRLLVAFLLVFIVILIIGSLINRLLSIFIRSTGLLGTNLLLGMIFGFARGILLIAIFILFAEMTSVVKDPWWHSSQLIPYFQGVTNWLRQFIPTYFDNISHYLILKPKAGS